MNKFKIGDIVTPLEDYGWHPTWIGRSMKVTEIRKGLQDTYLNVIVNNTRMTARACEFRFAGETVIDKVLNKYL
jgi:hypothetical protein